MFAVYLLIGLVMLVAGAELLVRGGGQFALAMRIPALVVGLTIVAFGTSAPELLVSVTAAMSASTEMALGNVLGSNLANILLVLGAAAFVQPLTVERSLMRREIPSIILLQASVPVLAWDGVISRGDGVILLIMGVVYNVWLLVEALSGRAPISDDELDMEDQTPWWKNLLLLVVGIAILVIGAQLFVEGAEAVARTLGLSDRVIGMTVVALGTSAPEMATAMVGAKKGEVELAVGNSLGSNLLNIAMVLGITSMISPIYITEPGTWNDMAMAMAATLILVPVVLKGIVNRVDASLFILAYLAYMLGGLLFF